MPKVDDRTSELEKRSAQDRDLMAETIGKKLVSRTASK